MAMTAAQVLGAVPVARLGRTYNAVAQRRALFLSSGQDRLAGAGFAKKGNELPLGYFERDILEGNLA